VETERRHRYSWVGRLVLLASTLAILILAWIGLNFEPAPAPAIPVAAERIDPAEPLAQSPPDGPAVELLTESSVEPSGALFFGLRSQGNTQIWAYSPENGGAIQLTDSGVDSEHPAVSPDGQSLAFSSARYGSWDLYLLDFASGDIRQLTSTPGYEGRPTWSPDGLWLAYEAYHDGDLDIWILPVDGKQDPIQLTNHSGVDYAPTWDPNGRKIAFISDRDGYPDIFIADLDHPDQRFTNLTQTPELLEDSPSFSPDGTSIAYSARGDQLETIYVQPLQGKAYPLGQGSGPSWYPGGGALAAVIETPLDAYVVTYRVATESQDFAPAVSGRISEIAWANAVSPAAVNPIALEASGVNPSDTSGRASLVELDDTNPKGIMLSDRAVEAYYALRERAADEVGWDLLANLDYGFVGINDPLPPGFAYNDWLYTGRAFAISQGALQAGWIEIVREDFFGETYWRIFVKVNPQDGTRGKPLRTFAWDLSARYTGDPTKYDRGGVLKSGVPSGYYVDFTTLAADFGFGRLTALPNWRTFYPGARYSEFALTEGMDWGTAMLELYPPEAVVTPTRFKTPTSTPTLTPSPTRTPWWWRWRTPTPSLIPSATSEATP
jgi:TolB protein